LTDIINKVEKAIYLNITTLVIFWDVRRAFNSTPCHLQHIAWLQLVILPDVAEWFVQ
jgi:hypothetical protein